MHVLFLLIICTQFFDKLTQLKQGTMLVDAYYMEMEILLQHARVRESVEMTMQHFLHGLKFTIKGIVRHHQYTNMNELLHHAREAEAQLAESGASPLLPNPRTSPLLLNPCFSPSSWRCWRCWRGWRCNRGWLRQRFPLQSS